MKVVIKNIERIFDQFFKIDRAVIQHEKFDGTMTSELVRLNFERGSSVAILLFNPLKKTVLFTKQFRFPAWQANTDHGWMLEIPAGMVPSEIEPKTIAIQETEEEVGYTITDAELIYDVFPTPGGSSERLFLYYAEVGESQRTSSGGGIEDEGEDIQIIEMPIEDAFAQMSGRKIVDAKTIIALQWLHNKINK